MVPVDFETLALGVLNAASPDDKVAAARHAAATWQQDGPLPDPDALPNRPARPDRPRLVAPNELARRRLGTEAGRIALLHSLAHIELNAIDLAFDMASRFARECDETLGSAQDFISDWLMVGVDEALHFELLANRLQVMGSSYGALDAHDGLWQAALTTKENFRARLSVVPMVLEARGLDVTPATVDRLRRMGDDASADILDQIYHDEITHVATGVKWFKRKCEFDEISEDLAFHKDLDEFFKGNLKGPFNEKARTEAGLLPKLYSPSP